MVKPKKLDPLWGRVLFWCVISFLLGVALALINNLSLKISLKEWLKVGGWLILVFIFIFPRKNLIAIFLVVLFFMGGIIRTGDKLNQLKNIYQGNFYGWVKIINDPEIKHNYQQLKVKPISLDKNKKKTSSKIKRKALIFLPNGLPYHYGNKLKIFCYLKKPINRHKKFNYQKFLAKDNLYQICQHPKIEQVITSTSIPNNISVKEKFWKMIFLTKKSLEDKINQFFYFPQSAYLAGLLLGGDNRLPEEVAQNFRLTGTTHTVAVSGYNITILAQGLMLLGIWFGLWRGQAFYLALGGIIFFILIIGWPASAVRAAIMGGLLLWATKRGRLSDAFRTLVLVAGIMVAFQPLILFYDAGFQLSFLATLGIILFYTPLAEHWKIENDFLELKSIFLVTLSAQIGVLGLLLYSFESFSPISFLANLLILPLIPLIMLGGLIVMLMGFIVPFLAESLALPVDLMLRGELKIIEWLAHTPLSSWPVKNFSKIHLLIYYSLFTGVVLWLRNQEIFKKISKKKVANDN